MQKNEQIIHSLYLHLCKQGSQDKFPVVRNVKEFGFLCHVCGQVENEDFSDITDFFSPTFTNPCS